MNYVVTGGAGFIGSNITEELVKKGHDVIVVDNMSSGKRENLRKLSCSGRVTFIEGSITDLGLLKQSFVDIDGVFHEAAIVSVPWSVEHPLETAEVNVIGTMNVLLAARDCGVKKVVFASSSAIYGDNLELPKYEGMQPEPKSPYALSKITGEYLGDVFFRTYGLSFAGLRYFNVYGPGQDPSSAYAAVIPKFISRILCNKPPLIFGNGSQTRDFIFVRDVVTANITAMEKRVTGIFNIATGTPISVNELALLIPQMMQKDTIPVYEPERPGDILHSYANVSRMKKELFSPEYPLQEGLKETIEWYRNNH